MNSLRAVLCLVVSLDPLLSVQTYWIEEPFRSFSTSQNSRFKRFTIRNKDTLKWNKRKITYHFVSFSSKMDAAATRAEFARATDEWSRHSGIAFQEVQSDKADLLISFSTGRHGDTRFDPPFDGRSGSLAHAFPPDGSRIAGDIHFDDDEDWAINATAKDEDKTDFYSVALHELGHSLGLSHSEELQSVMSSEYGERLRTNLVRLQPDDIEGIQTLYAHFITSIPTRQPTTKQAWRGTISTTKRAETTTTTTIVPTKSSKPTMVSTTNTMLEVTTEATSSTTTDQAVTAATKRTHTQPPTASMINETYTSQPTLTTGITEKFSDHTATPIIIQNHTEPSAHHANNDTQTTALPMASSAPEITKYYTQLLEQTMEDLVTTTEHPESSSVSSVTTSCVKFVNRKSGRDQNKINDDGKFEGYDVTTKIRLDVNEHDHTFRDAVSTEAPSSVPRQDNGSTPTLDPLEPSSATTLTPIIAILWTTLFMFCN